MIGAPPTREPIQPLIPSTSSKHVLETDEPLLLKVRDVARLCSLSRSEAYELVHRSLHPIRIGTAIRVRRLELENWISQGGQ